MTAPRYQVALCSGPNDNFAVTPQTGELVVGLRMDGAPGPDDWRVDETVWTALKEYGLVPTQMATDFFRFATSVYSADLRVPHRTAFDRWSRDITLHLPVADVVAWERANEALTKLVDFLTGDHWTLVFREQESPPPKLTAAKGAQPNLIAVSSACLLSGGLDSAIGAVDLSSKGEKTAFISHNSKSGGASFSSPSQRDVLKIISKQYGADSFRHFRFRVNPPRPIVGLTEGVTTTRSRSIMFFALGILVTTALALAQGEEEVPLVVPENGLISLNVPLTKARLGSWSTRTTHPHTLSTLREALGILGIKTSIRTPYATRTKGEMILDSNDQAACRQVASVSISCAHPNQSRFLPASRRKSHCGTCVPCIIRRAALQHAGMDDGMYSFDLPSDFGVLQAARAKDVKAFLFALKHRRKPATLFDINRNGPLHAVTDDQLRELLRVYDAGMDEVASHLGV